MPLSASEEAGTVCGHSHLASFHGPQLVLQGFLMLLESPQHLPRGFPKFVFPPLLRSIVEGFFMWVHLEASGGM